ncbi:hypothetical protein MTR_5g077300 [Medicago truncatula]|uniref:Uncharacterized protein n=1 Tax=Medicago truncatula TaxID=3880 RepID=G7KFX3_MEDTR|nr:hypothetical protein MTR_5g077300 [Medicago truncatula]
MVAAGKLVSVPFSRIKQKLSVTIYDCTGRTPSEIVNNTKIIKSQSLVPALILATSKSMGEPVRMIPEALSIMIHTTKIKNFEDPW